MTLVKIVNKLKFDFLTLVKKVKNIKIDFFDYGQKSQIFQSILSKKFCQIFTPPSYKAIRQRYYNVLCKLGKLPISEMTDE